MPIPPHKSHAKLIVALIAMFVIFAIAGVITAGIFYFAFKSLSEVDDLVKDI